MFSTKFVVETQCAEFGKSFRQVSVVLTLVICYTCHVETSYEHVNIVFVFNVHASSETISNYGMVIHTIVSISKMTIFVIWSKIAHHLSSVLVRTHRCIDE